MARHRAGLVRLIESKLYDETGLVSLGHLLGEKIVNSEWLIVNGE